MKSFLPEFNISKVLLDSAHDAMPYYQYFKRVNIKPFIDLTEKAVDHLFIKMILPSIKMVFPSVLLVFVCVAIASKLQNVRN